MKNRLIELLESGRIMDEPGLKSAFRGIAKRIHPDLAEGSGAASRGRAEKKATEAFIALRSEYEEALAWLGASGSLNTPPGEMPRPGTAPPEGLPPLPWSEKTFYENLEELLARGFPRQPSVPGPRGLYVACRGRVMRLLAGRDRTHAPGTALSAFLDFEAGYAALVAADPAGLSREVRLSHGLRNLVFNIVLFHDTGFAQLARFARNEWIRLRKELIVGKEARPLAFLSMLMDDLGKGPACVED